MSEAKTAGGYIWRIKELEQENLELKAHVEGLREMLISTIRHWDNDDDPIELQPFVAELNAALDQNKSQSLAAHDRGVAEKMRRFISHELNCNDEGLASDLVDILDLDEVLKDE